MAEFVLRNKEEMLPEFEQMQRVGIFSDEELKSIIKKTTAHEYKLVRRVKDKKDFLSYIQYKIHLLALIKKRRKKINYYFKKDEIEFAIVREVHRLFKKCSFLWPEDLKIWLSHVEFCKEWNKKTQLSKIWTSVLQIHGNKNVHLWAMAAKWQLEDNLSVENARKIFLQGIRHHEDEPKLWHEYFRMELIHSLKMRQRLALLTEEEKDHEVGGDSLLKGEAACIVYNNAIKTIPNDVKFKCGFLDIALLFSYFAGEIVNTIIDDLLDNHSQDPAARSAIAKLHMNPKMKIQSDASDSTSDIARRADVLSAEKRCWEEFESAVKELDTPEMWGEYFSYLHARLMETKALQSTDMQELGFEITGVNKDAAANGDPSSNPRTIKFLEVAARAHRAKKLSPEDHIKYANILVDSERLDQAITVLRQADQESTSVDLRIELLSLLVQNQTENSSSQEVISSFHATVPSVPQMTLKQDLKFWKLWFEYCVQTENGDLMSGVVEEAIKSKSMHSDHVQALYLEWYVNQHGVDKALEFYREKLTATRSASLSVIQTLIRLLDASCDDKSSDVTSCFEEAVSSFGKDKPDLWLEYISHALKIEPSKVGNIHWRAMRSLEPALVERFITGYTLLQNGVAPV